MGKNAKGFEFKKFATPRVIGGIAIAVIVLWALSIIFRSPQSPAPQSKAERQNDSIAATALSGNDGQGKTTLTVHRSTATGSAKGPTDTVARTTEQKDAAVQGDTAARGTTTSLGTAPHPAPGTAAQGAAADTANQGADRGLDATTAHGVVPSPEPASHDAPGKAKQATTTHEMTTVKGTAGSQGHAAARPAAAHGTTAKSSGPAPAQQPASQRQPVTATDPDTQAGDHATAGQPAAPQAATAGHPLPSSVASSPVPKPKPKGVTFVEATIKPLNHELEERWWGWRPNDIIDVTDNVNNFQLGVLEVTRRITVALVERISRHGVTDAFDPNLEEAMNWFMVKASSYWFPSAESKYRDGLEELQVYLEKLKAGKATFYTRADNLIPLLASFEDLLGSCDENLVKQVNEDGTAMSFFSVDDYFFYTQGVASSMATVLEAVHHDFLLTLESRNATELLHHAILSCQRAAEVDPWIVLDRNLSSVFANHRANMAAPISHARFYIGQLIKTLST